MSTTDGYKAIQKIATKMTPLVEHLVRFHPGGGVLRMYRLDYACIAEHPPAARMLGFDVQATTGRIFFRGFECLPHRLEEK